MQNNRKHALLFIVAALLLVRFGLDPLYRWKESATEQLENSEQRLNKATALLERREELTVQNQQLERRLQAAESSLFEAMPETMFRLDRQSWLESKAASFNLRMEQVSWSPIRTVGQGIIQHQMDVVLSGDMDDIIRFHLEFGQSSQFVHLSEFNLVISRHLQYRIGTGRLSATLAFYSKKLGE